MIIIDRTPRYRESSIIPSSDDQRSSSSFSLSQTPIIEDDRSSLAVSTRAPTPIIEDDRSSLAASTRAPTPILEDEQRSSIRRDSISLERLDNNFERIEKQIKSIQSILVKQGKQIRAIYDLQKNNNERVEKVHSHLKKLNKEKGNELSAKVFSVSNFISNSIILQ